MNRESVLKTVIVFLLSLMCWVAVAEEVAFETTLREADGLMSETEVQPFREQESLSGRRVRDYPMQPPTIPHAIEGYVLTKDMNQCLVCHDSKVAPQMGAPAVAVSHFQNRDGDYLMNVSPRRYFCTQCHVPQATRLPLVENSFLSEP